NFWATWCGPCQEELPAVEATSARYANQVQVIGVDQAEAPDVVQSYVAEFQLTYPIVMDKDNSVANHYNVKGMPTTFFIDGDGVIRHMWMGEMNRITLAEGVTKILR
ncbi:MAG: TlpA disulfide reductase family protein, partial [Chloroflexi bacterium]|nr:TlpA disulfide reductase family protein [Chloroflexota bacterium]